MKLNGSGSSLIEIASAPCYAPDRVEVVFQVPEGALAALRQDPEHFSRELRLAAAAKWYEMQRVSQGRAAEIAGLSRAEFVAALARFGVSPFQETIDELAHEARGA